jgi:predicted nuclease of restriction endonuclease-like RecB superfamily
MKKQFQSLFQQVREYGTLSEYKIESSNLLEELLNSKKWKLALNISNFTIGKSIISQTEQ